MNRRVNSAMIVSLHAALAEGVALCAAMAMDASSDVPDWVHLLPAGGEVRTVDGRGPYKADLNAIAAAFATGSRLVLDENHSTDLAAPEGRPAPAMGWIVQLQARDTGLWGQVEWTDAGRTLVASKAYRGVSPALFVEKGTSRIGAVLRASLVNRPNIKDLIALHQETDVTLLQKLLAALGLKDGTSEDTLVTAITALHQAQTTHSTELQSIAGAAGLKAGETVSGETILAAIGKLKTAPAGDKAIVELQAELATVTTELNTLKSAGARDKAEAFVDGAIKLGTVGVKPLRDHYISRHMANPADVEKEIGALPRLDGTSIVPTARREGELSLNAVEEQVIAQLGLDPKKFVATRDGTTVA